VNKTVTPRQLELVKDMTREEAILAAAPHIDPDSPALKADLATMDKFELAEAAAAALGGIASSEEEEDFDWNKDDAVILKEQRATAVYYNRAGELIIRQRATWDEDTDTFVFVSPENIVAFLEGAAKRARE
jgi:hypothetical protein